MSPACDDTLQRLNDACVTLKSKLAHVMRAVQTLEGDARVKSACVEDTEKAVRDIEDLQTFMHNVWWRYDTMLEMVADMTGMNKRL